MGEGGERPKMGVMVMPGFMIGATVIQSQCIPMRDIEDYEYANYNHVPYDLGNHFQPSSYRWETLPSFQ
ncbi:hypothetical protein QJS10_CPB21g01512 [Acorus calamus]|uniref:Uncharacterized protein n=1 Tax=Acorus calamus TaxID=4465 RepID=A0AAV9C5W7_ACOCL|nr:hypothetical protein QJS10_CPB21g01512 [Acorus calamus]